ncbi:hypothetical protein BV113_00600 [Glutamicibacter phage BIM BV-113]|nr:hypothetical protein BV113_00600 [Glutamicibacter phage BIM BV-113]
MRYMSTQNSDQRIDEKLASMFADEIASQFTMAVTAYHSLETSIHKPGVSTNVSWYHLESLIKSFIAITNILWSQNNRNPHRRRAALLRKRFGVTDMSIPKDLRDTRNSLEHFDERLDIWWQEDPLHNIADRCIGRKVEITNIPGMNFARHFDPSTGDFSVFGDTVNLHDTLLFMNQIALAVERSGFSLPTNFPRIIAKG